MKQLVNIESKNSGIYSEFNTITSIEVEDNPFSDGTFGEVYNCLSVNNIKTKKEQVIKIFKELNGFEEKGFDTIQILQEKINDKVFELIRLNKDFEHEYPALLGCPQFSFKGMLNGKKVMGYSSNNLNSLGFEEFKPNDPIYNSKYNTLSLKDRFTISYQLVKAFELLHSFLYIHADFKSDALFINFRERQCALIDFDSGAVMQSNDDKPTTYGTKQDWLAPEIYFQIAEEEKNRKNANDRIPVKVDLLSDIWSISVCIHYLIFCVHPYFSFKEVTKRSLKEYTNKGYSFPDIDHTFIWLTEDKSILNVLNGNYKNGFNKLPNSIKNKFAQTFSKGCLNPNVRTTVPQWKTVLKPLTSLSKTKDKIKPKSNYIEQSLLHRPQSQEQKNTPTHLPIISTPTSTPTSPLPSRLPQSVVNNGRVKPIFTYLLLGGIGLLSLAYFILIPTTVSLPKDVPLEIPTQNHESISNIFSTIGDTKKDIDERLSLIYKYITEESLGNVRVVEYGKSGTLLGEYDFQNYLEKLALYKRIEYIEIKKIIPDHSNKITEIQIIEHHKK